MDMVPFTASPGDTKIAVVLMFTGPKKERKVAWVRSHIFPLNSIHRKIPLIFNFMFYNWKVSFSEQLIKWKY